MEIVGKKQSKGLVKQSGFTLIELMVASALGVVVIGGMVTLFTVNKESVRLLSNISTAQEKANFALELMAEDAQMAGWPGVFDPAGSDPFGIRANGTYGQFATTQRFDTFVVSRRERVAIPGHPDPLKAQNEMDCVGNVIPTGQGLVHRYFVDPVTQNLICQSLPSGEMQTIIGNVEGFKVLYGIDTTQGPCTQINPDLSIRDAGAECMAPTLYLSGNDLAAALTNAALVFGDPSHLRPIKTIKLAIAVSTEETQVINPALGIARSNFSLLGQAYANGQQGSDFSQGRVIKYSLRTVALRQALRGP